MYPFHGEWMTIIMMMMMWVDMDMDTMEVACGWG